MASSMDNFEKLMMAMALKHIVEGAEDLKLHPFTCEIIATPMSVECVTSGNKALLEDLDGGKEWFQETNDRIKDIMSEQTTKLAEIMKKKFGFETIAADSNSKDGFAKFMETLFGGVQTIANKINNLPAIAFSW